MRQFLCVLTAALTLGGCSTELDVTAPEKPIVAVYGVLNPNAPVQYVRLSKGFSVEDDAIQFAATADLGFDSAAVFLTYRTEDGDSGRLDLFPVDTLKEPGVFTQEYRVYATAEPLIPTATYTLTAEIPAGSDGFGPLTVTATALLPGQPDVILPADSVALPGFENFAWSEVDFTKAPSIEFLPENLSSGQRTAAAYEVRVELTAGLSDFAGDTTQVTTVTYGPLGPVLPEGNCISQRLGTVCFRFGEGAFIGFADNALPQGTRLYDASNKSPAAAILVTALDVEFFNYLRVNDPAFQDFTTISPQYTNVSVSNGGIGVGVLGAVNEDRHEIRLAQCTQFELGLNAVAEPPQGCD